MSDQQIEDIHTALATLLPNAITRAVTSYEAFATQAPPDDAKAFSAHHSACKAALVHLDYLTKLAKWVETKNQSTGDKTPSLEPLIIAARETLMEYDTKNDRA